MLEAIVGAVVGVLTILLARVVRAQRWMYAIGLLVLPGLYALFAVVVGEGAVGVREMVYGIPFVVVGLACALVSMRRSAVVVGAFWILHGAYDLVHDRCIANSGVPAWYPVWCCAVDVVVGSYLLWLARRLPAADLRQA